MLLADDAQREVKVVELLMETKLFPDADAVLHAARSFYNKLVIADSYNVESKYEGPVMLLKAKDGHADTDILGKDYGLSKVRAARVFLVLGSMMMSFSPFYGVLIKDFFDLIWF